jgi:hypothetical protein
MGYYVTGNGYMVIKKENLDNAYEALMALQDAPANAKRGGSYSGGQQTASWFSWMPQDLRTLTSTQEVFEQLGFEVQESDNGDLVIGYYDNKTGQEDIFVAAVAEFIEDGEYEWTGEDSAFWLWMFEDGKMFVRQGTREYGEAQEFRLDDLVAEQVEVAERLNKVLAK